MVYTTPHPDDDAQLAAWRRRQAEDAVRSINIRLPLDLARRLRAEAAERRLSVGRYVGNLLRTALGDLPPVPTPPVAASVPVTPPPPTPVDPGQVRLRDLRIIQLREGRDGEPRQLAVADKAIVLRILEADLAWLKDSDHRAP
jgi:hypothetical protein